MEVLDPGHKYKLHTLDGTVDSRLVFVKREGAGYPGNVGSYPGTTCQEVLRALLERLAYLNDQIPCWENRVAYSGCLVALWCFEFRHARRKGRWLKVSPKDLLEKPVCTVCGHVSCEDHNE